VSVVQEPDEGAPVPLPHKVREREREREREEGREGGRERMCMVEGELPAG
jgi:hypothetical protein